LQQKHRRYQFEDGYEQRTIQGVNPWKLEVSANFLVQGFEDEPTSPYVTLRDFLIQVGQTVPFEFELPGYGTYDMIVTAAPRQRSLGWGAWEFGVQMETWNVPGTDLFAGA
jgi:phage-related protein